MNNKIVAYSLLAHLNESQQLSKNYDSLFSPLVKRVLATMSRDRSFEGADILEIKEHVDKEYGWDIPPATLKRLLKTIEFEINSAHARAEHELTDQPEMATELMHVYQDGSFIIKPHTFKDYDEEINQKNKELKELEAIYYDFLKSENLESTVAITSIYDFVEQSKASLGKYINTKYQVRADDNTVEARFINFISNIPKLYAIFQSIYIGSIISTYLEYEPKDANISVELVLDTNFIISLLDLNTPQSTTNCKKLVSLGKKLGYKFTVLEITLREIDSLLHTKIELFNTSFFASLLNPEDIYNACRRRHINKTDLEKIRSNVEKEIISNEITIVANVSKYEQRAKYSDDYDLLRKHRNTDFAALHDATCIDYVRSKRNRNIYEFSKVNCWFVNNSSTKSSGSYAHGVQPITIKAEDLLNMLWLSSPRIKRILSVSEVATIGISRLVASTLNDALPKSKIIDELDRNIAKYTEEDISDEDLIRVSKSIGQRSVTNIDELNALAESDGQAFITRLHEIAKKQKEKEDGHVAIINNVVKEFTDQTKLIQDERKSILETREQLETMTMEKGSLVEQLKRERTARIAIQNGLLREKRAKFLSSRIFRWRLKSWIQLIISLCIPFLAVYIVYIFKTAPGGAFSLVWVYCKSNPISYVLGVAYLFIPGFVINGLSMKYNNHSNLVAFRNDVNYPDDLALIVEESIN